jgi:hypothetical protein
MQRLSLTTLLAVLALGGTAPGLAAPPTPAWAGTADNQAAVGGYDPVAYFSGTPALGSDAHSLVHQGGRFRFASAANLQAFRADPARYAPQFDGHCAWAASQGRKSVPDPTFWHIVGGKLCLNCSKDADAKWLADVPGNIAKAEAYWAAQAK